jgi:hypothetical protein
MLSDEGVKDAISEADVEQKVNDCLQDWSAASSKAVQEMMEKQRQEDNDKAAEAARAQFVISLIGNLAWAATVFFPPAAAVEVMKDIFGANGYRSITTIESPGPSAATKVVSVLGAAVGSNIYGQLVRDNGTLDWIALEKHLDELVPKIRKGLKSVAQAWTDRDLAYHMTKVFSTKQNLRTDKNDDKQFKEWVKSYEGKEEVRRTVWEKLVFPVGGLEFDRGVPGLQDFQVGKLTELKKSFDRQYKDFLQRRTYAYWAYFQQAGGYTGAPKSFWDWNMCCSSSFHFVANIEGLPSEFLKAQDQRLRELEINLSSADIHSRIPKPAPAPPRGMQPWGS